MAVISRGKACIAVIALSSAASPCDEEGFSIVWGELHVYAVAYQFLDKHKACGSIGLCCVS